MSLENKSPEEIEALAHLADVLANDPKTRQGFLRLTKTANPTASIPELDTMDAIGAQMKPHLDRLAHLESEAEKRRIEDKIRAQRKQALAVDGVKSSDLPAIEKLMTERGIPDHKTAAEFMVLQQRAAEPTTASVSASQRTFGVPKAPDAKEFNGNIQSWARNEARTAIDELRGRPTRH